MYTVTKRIFFCYGHRLLKHKGRCANLHGHNAVAEITCGGQKLDEEGMVIDFDKIMQTIGHWVDENLDHRMILDSSDDLVQYLKSKNETFFAMDCDPTAENIAKMIFAKAVEFDLPVVDVSIWETPTSKATYLENR